MVKEFEILVDIYGKPDKKGLQKLIKKNTIIKRTLETEDYDVTEYVNDNGSLSKKYSLLIDKRNTTNTFKLNMPYNKAKVFLADRDIYIKGYKRY